MPMKSARRYNKTPSRRKVPGVGAQAIRGTRTPIIPTFGVVAGSTIPVTFDQPVIVKGLPDFQGDTGVSPLSVVVDSATQITLTYNTAPTDPFTVSFEDPAVRNNAGGYVQPGEYANA